MQVFTLIYNNQMQLHRLSLLHIFILAWLSAGTATAQTMEKKLTDWLETFSRWDAVIGRPTLVGCNIDDAEKTVTVTFGGGFQEQHFTPVVVDSIYERVRSFIPERQKKYDLAIVTENHRIEELVPNFFRKRDMDKSRLSKEEYKGSAWVRNISRPYTATDGLDNCHISLWQSHGKYWKQDMQEWRWQRPRLFCTCEDLFSQTFVIPYIIPMLQNAGAIVFTPRERDWQANEVIVDNDTPQRHGSYIESHGKKKKKQKWENTPTPGFADTKAVYTETDTPFSYGTARYIPVTSSAKDEATVQWVPNIPESGQYAVYVSYQTYENSIPDARYTVHHKGGTTEFKVNQQMGAGTWVYLGTFEFEQGLHETGMVTLSNQSDSKGIVTADAVRFGGGMSNIAVLDPLSGTLHQSGLPRWAEAAKYSAIWYGFPYSVHSERFQNNDYNNDINSRSAAINYLSGGSIYNKQTVPGMKVPLELNIAFHTDAGYRLTDELIGPLAIYMTDSNDGQTAAGLDRYVSRDFASMLLTNLTTDLKEYNWHARRLWNRNYGEAREPLIPACILEMLSHQNWNDLRLGYDPHFKFSMCRSIYKSIVKFIATQHNRDYVIQPLPVKDFSVTLNEARKTAHLSWTPTLDPLEPTAKPQKYIVYTRIGNLGFDNGTVVSGTSHDIELQPGIAYSFKVAALNKGGESFPSETLAAGIAPNNLGTTLIVNAFTRLEGPQPINTECLQGFDLDADPGIQYGAFAGFSGRQIYFDKECAGMETDNGLGVSGEELAGKVIMGNTFDYAAIHGKAILAAGHSFASVSQSALLNHFSTANELLSEYPFVDIYYGAEKHFDPNTSRLISNYISLGGRTLISGAYIGSQYITDKTASTITGCGMTFDIWREMNPYSYNLPMVTTVQPTASAFSILVYPGGYSAAIASNTSQHYIKLGFPLESIKDTKDIYRLTAAFMSFLRQ